MCVIEKARECLKGTGFGKSSQKIGGEIGEDPSVVSMKLCNHDDFVGLSGGMKGRKVFVLRENFSDGMEVWLE